MKGFSKALARTPQMLGTKVGLSKKTSDVEFEDLQRQFAAVEDATTKLLKDSGIFTDSVIALLTSGQSFATHFFNLFQPIGGEFDIIGKHPESAETIRNVGQYQSIMEELRNTLSPELELIESRIVGPLKEFQVVLKQIRKGMTKRDHKLTDYDRHKSSVTKLREKKEKSLNDEKNLFKLEQEFENASNDYESINNAMKTDLPRFFSLSTQFIDPLYHSFYYMQLNVFYLVMEKLQGFTQSKYVTTGSGQDIASNYETQRADAAERIEALSLTKRMISTSKMMQTRQAGSAKSGTTTSAVVGATTPAFSKKPPPPPSSSSSSSAAAPPPYSASPASASPVVKKAPPPPPPLKPKAKAAEPPKQYVVALYDFAAQAEGDLDFRVGDRIEVVEKSDSVEDWWTGRLNGRQGVFPGNYVQDV